MPELSNIEEERSASSQSTRKEQDRDTLSTDGDSRLENGEKVPESEGEEQENVSLNKQVFITGSDSNDQMNQDGTDTEQEQSQNTEEDATEENRDDDKEKDRSLSQASSHWEEDAPREYLKEDVGDRESEHKEHANFEDDEQRPRSPCASEDECASVASDLYLGDSLDSRLNSLAELLEKEYTTIKSCHFKDYLDVHTLSCLQIKSEHVIQETESLFEKLATKLNAIQRSSASLHQLITKKLLEESLMSWINGDPAPVYEKELLALEKEHLSRAAEIRAKLGKVNLQVANLEEQALRLEVEVEEASAAAVEARRDAEKAKMLAEEARRAAELKARTEEEARRKAEEEKARKEEEERRRREEKERRLQELQRKGLSPEEEERRRQEAARRDPSNWDNWMYSVEPGDIGIPLGCVIRAFPDDPLERESLHVEVLEQASGVFTLEDHEELVSHIIKISYTDEKRSLKEPLSVCIPHCAPRNVVTREPAIKMLQLGGRWTELPTTDVQLEDIKEYKFVEARLPQPATLAVVFRFRREKFNVSKRAVKVIPSVDPRICISVPKALFKNNLTIMTEIHPVELSMVTDVKLRKPDDCDSLLASSPIVNLELPVRKLQKPLTVSVPLPPNQAKLKRDRPSTAAGNERTTKAQSMGRPKSAFTLSTRKDEEAEDQINLLSCDANGHWMSLQDIALNQSKNKDAVAFEMKEPLKRFIVLRTKPDTAAAKCERMVAALEAAVKQRSVTVLLRQRSEDPADVVMQCLNSNRLERFQRRLAEEGYDDGPLPSGEIIMHEGQLLKVRFRGNIESVQQQELRLVFNSHIKARLEYTVAEIDKFAQKSIGCYRGFAQVFTKGLVRKLVPRDEEAAKQKNPPMKEVWVEGDALLCELLINLPKPEPEPPKPISRAPVTFKPDGIVDEQLLRQLAGDLGEEWKKLANYLNVRRNRIQAILLNNKVKSNTEQTIFDMLMTWAKKVPRSLNKVEILSTALISCGRIDLAESIRDQDFSFKKERARSSRGSLLKKAFVKVSQSPHASSSWRYIGEKMGVSDEELDSVAEEYQTDRERCYHMLYCWQDIARDEATIKVLTKHLRRLKYHAVAEQVNCIG